MKNKNWIERWLENHQYPDEGGYMQIEVADFNKFCSNLIRRVKRLKVYEGHTTGQEYISRSKVLETLKGESK